MTIEQSNFSEQFKKFFTEPLNELVAAGEANKEMAEKILAFLEPVITFKAPFGPMFYSIKSPRCSCLDKESMVMEWGSVMMTFLRFQATLQGGKELDVLSASCDIASRYDRTPVSVEFRDKPVTLRKFLANRICD